MPRAQPPPLPADADRAALFVTYQVVAARRAQWDSLLWQVPTLSLTAQAFLFTVALGGGDKWSRSVASLLALLLSVMSVMLMARHRQSEIKDAHWLEDVESSVFKLGDWGAHGEAFRNQREAITEIYVGPPGSWIPLKPMFNLWAVGLSTFGLAAIAVIVRTLFFT
jgi:hypothetical protein